MDEIRDDVRDDVRDETEVEIGTARERVIMLSDGVFAIAATLLVIDIALPALPKAFAAQEAQLPSALASLVPRIGSYALSFTVIAIYWMAHERMFRYIKRADNGLIWANTMFLMGIAFLPVPTRVLGSYGDHAVAVRFYAASQVYIGVALAFIWWYASRRHRLVASALSDVVIRRSTERALLTPAIFLFTFGVSYVAASLAEVSLVALSFVAAIFERHLRDRLLPAAN